MFIFIQHCNLKSKCTWTPKGVVTSSFNSFSFPLYYFSYNNFGLYQLIVYSWHEPTVDFRSRERPHVGRDNGEPDGALLRAQDAHHVSLQHQGLRGHGAQREQGHLHHAVDRGGGVGRLRGQSRRRTLLLEGQDVCG